ncbi:MAG TPA: hypothetical protein VLM85_08560 [Polyangiaceae bacterium]|nr:hypothetical protein [Polyangiaceae bacterium]
MVTRWLRPVVVAALASACTRGDASPSPAANASSASAASAWKAPAEPGWPELPRDAAAADQLVAKEAVRAGTPAVEAASLRTLGADAAPLVGGEDAIAAALDAWMRIDPKRPAFVVFGTTHDSRAQLEAVRSIAVRMKSPWALAVEQFRASGKWKDAPRITTADDADLAAFASPRGAVDDAVSWRLRERQQRLDHAAWKYGYSPALIDLLWAARGASLPIVGCDMPPELHAGLSNDETLSSLRELHCARSLRSSALGLAAAHLPANIDDDDPPPPERFAVLVGRAHAEGGGLSRFLPKDARVRTVVLLGGRARGVPDEEEKGLAETLVVTDPVLVHLAGDVAPPKSRSRAPATTGDAQDALLLPDEVWGGDVDRASDPGVSPGPAGAGLPDRNVLVSSDEPATFAIGDARVRVGPKPEWLSASGGRQAYVLVGEARRFVGAVDVPSGGYAEVHFVPKERAMSVVLHLP